MQLCGWVLAFFCLMGLAGAGCFSEGEATLEQSSEPDPEDIPSPARQADLSENDLSAISESANREIRVERARRVAPVDLTLGAE